MSLINVYGTTWCGDCKNAKDFLDSNNIKYEWTDLDKNPDLYKYVRDINNGQEIVPTIVFPDGSFLSEPSNQQLKEKLGL